MKHSLSIGSRNHTNTMQLNQRRGSDTYVGLLDGIAGTRYPAYTPWYNAVRFELAVEELAKNELALVERYVEDDIQRATEYWSDLKHELSWWETQAGVYCLQAADPTPVQWLQLQFRWQASASIIIEGERLQDNTICCLQCAQSYQIIGIVDVAACVNCGGEYFSCGRGTLAH